MKTAAPEEKIYNPPTAAPIQVSLMQHTLGLATFGLGGSVVFAFLLDLVGLPVRPWTVGPLVLALIGLAGWNLGRQVRRGKYSWGGYDFAEFVAFGLVFGGFLAYAFWLGKPNLLPVGTTVDAVHQYGLADYIGQSGRLPIHATELRANLQDGLAYPPAYVIIVSLIAQTFKLDPLYLLYPVAAFLAALATAATFAVVSLLLRGRPWRLPLAGLAAGLTFVPYGYTFGSFTSQNYFAQVFAHALLVMTLFFLLAWRRDDSAISVGLFGLTEAALLICYPTFALIPLATFGLLVLFWKGRTWRTRLLYLAGILIPLGILAFLFLKDRLETGLGTVANEGEVLQPDLNRYGWPVLVVAMFGLGFTLWQGKPGSWIVALFGGLLALEGLALWLLKGFFNQGSYYAVYKQFYPALYLVVVLAAIGLDWLLRRFALGLEKRSGPKLHLGRSQAAWLASLIAVGLYGAFLAGTWVIHPKPERATAVITPDEIKVAQWMKANLKLDEYAVGYNVPPGTPAYWLQVGIFKQPRGVRSNDLLNRLPLTFGGWFYAPDSNRYFFTDDLQQINLDERSQVLYQSGSAAVLTRTEAYDQQFGLRPGLTIQYTGDLKQGYLELRTEATLTQEASNWLKVGLEIEPAGGGPVIFSEMVPAEAGREKKQFMGIVVGVPNLKLHEFYSNQQNLTQPSPTSQPLAPGRYAAFMVLQKQGAVIVRHKLLEFTQAPSSIPVPDFGPGVPFGQYVFEGSLTQSLPPVGPFDFALNIDRFRLLGLQLPDKAGSGETIQAGLQWQIVASVSRSYKLRWVWLDENGQAVAQVEAVPLNGLYPTWLWPAAQPTTIRQGLKLPGKAGRYQLALALVDGTTGQASELKRLAKFIEVG